MIKELLMEAYTGVKSATGVDATNPAGFKQILAENKAWNFYVNHLTEHLDPSTKQEVMTIATATRQALLENSMYQLNPYETLVMPILTVFYPKLIARELVTVTPIDKPEVIKAVLMPKFLKWNDPNEYPAPSYDNISSGPVVDTATGGTAPVPGTYDILAAVGLTSDAAHIQKDLVITSVTVTDGTNTETVDVEIRPTVDGTISAAVSGTTVAVTDTLLGQVDYYNGTLTLSSANGAITQVTFTVTVSLEENTINPKLELRVEKLRLVAKDRQISAEWSIQMEQDLKALFDIDIQAQLVSIIGQQIALDIDKEIVSQLLATVQSALVPASHRGSFSRTPPATYTWGPKLWHTNILAEINPVAAAIYKDTNIQAGNILAVNPIDAAILEDIDTFAYNGNSVDGGDLGYQTATVAGGKYKVLVSPVIPEGKMLVTYKPAEEMKAVYYYAPYQPLILSPYPLGNKPSLTLLSRYATTMVRPLGLGLIEITP